MVAKNGPSRWTALSRGLRERCFFAIVSAPQATNMTRIALIIPAAPGVRTDALESAGVQQPPITARVETGTNPSANRNRGVAGTDSPLVAFTNAHAILRPDWASRVEAFFDQHPEVDIVGGPQLNYAQDAYFARLSGDALASPFCTAEMSRRYQPGALKFDAGEEDLSSANLICRRHVFERVRFDETIYPGEDPKFVTDARRAGFKVAYTPDIVVFNRRRESLGALWKQIFNYGSTRVQKESLGELLGHPKFFAPSAFTLYLASIPVWLLGYGWIGLLPLTAYGLLAFLFASLRAASCRRAEYVMLLPLLFLWIHLAYGAGFLSRLLAGGWAGESSC